MSKQRAIAALAAAWLVGCASGEASVEPPSEDGLGKGDLTVSEVSCRSATVDERVRIVDYAFEPAALAFEGGAVIQFTNEGDREHTATSGSPSSEDEGRVFDSGDLEPGDSWCARFEGRGRVDYHCEYHPQMRGSLEIAEEDRPPEM